MANYLISLEILLPLKRTVIIQLKLIWLISRFKKWVWSSYSTTNISTTSRTPGLSHLHWDLHTEEAYSVLVET